MSKTSKTVLVICSGPTQLDYPRVENKTMLRRLLGDNYTPEFMREYPEDLPTGKQFDAILFAGCNVITWIFKKKYEDGMQRLHSILKDDGIVIFVENPRYVSVLGKEGHGLSMSLNLIQWTNDGTETKQQILSTWAKYFREGLAPEQNILQKDLPIYIVYRKNMLYGGKRKKSLTKRRNYRKSKKTRRSS